MTVDEYHAELNAMKTRHEKEIKEFKTQYALSNNQYKIGDIIQDRYGIMKIEKITVSAGIAGSYPECVYAGMQLTKNLKPAKKQLKNRLVWQSNIIEKV